MNKNFVDKTVEFLAPQTAVKRYQAKIKIANADAVLRKQQDGQRGFNGASLSRHTAGWVSMQNQSTNTEIQQSLNILRSRSRDLVKNNEYARNAARIIPNNVVGTGIMPTPAIIGGTTKQLEKVKEYWKLWANGIKADFDQRANLYGLQRLIMRTTQVDGECFIKRVRAKSKYDVPLRIQLLPADFLDTSKHNITDENGEMCYYGVQFNKDGERTGYWLYEKHPAEFATVSKLHKAEDIIHVFDIEDTGQIRGVPFSSSSMIRTNDLDDYEFSERIRAKVAACFAGFVTDTDAEKDPAFTADLSKMEPGTLTELAPGKNIVFNSPPPVNGFDGFVRSNLRAIASGNGLTYEAMTNDYSNVNFSSGRMGWIEFSRNVQHWQWNVLIPIVCDTIFSWFIEAIKLRGVIPTNAIVAATWTAPRREMIDPYKETMARLESVRAGFTSITEILKEDGYNPEDHFEQLKKDAAMIDTLKLMPTSDPRFDAQRKDQNTGRTNAAASQE